MPAALEKCVQGVMDSGKDKGQAYAICGRKTGWVRGKGGWVNKKTGETYHTKTTKTNENYKSFKEFLNEYTTRSTYLHIANRNIPLNSGLMKRLGYYQEDVQAYHVTNHKYLKEMAKNQNKSKKQISAFTKGGPELARLPSQPDVLLLLEGDAVISGDTDIWTGISGRGIRWIEIGHKSSTSENKHAKKLKFYIDGVLQKLVDKYQIKDQGKEINVYKLSDTKLGSILFDYLIEMDKKEYQMLYKNYIQEMEHMLNTVGYKELNMYLKTISDMKYNEIILTKWKILEIKSLDYEDTGVAFLAKKYNIPYSVMPRKDLSKLEI